MVPSRRPPPQAARGNRSGDGYGVPVPIRRSTLATVVPMRRPRSRDTIRRDDEDITTDGNSSRRRVDDAVYEATVLFELHVLPLFRGLDPADAGSLGCPEAARGRGARRVRHPDHRRPRERDRRRVEDLVARGVIEADDRLARRERRAVPLLDEQVAVAARGPRERELPVAMRRRDGRVLRRVEVGVNGPRVAAVESTP